MDAAINAMTLITPHFCMLLFLTQNMHSWYVIISLILPHKQQIAIFMRNSIYCQIRAAFKAHYY